MEYNGWANKATYLASRWLEDYLAQELRDGNEVCAAHVKDTLNNMRADVPKLWGLFSDLIDDAMGQIDCYQIAERATEKSRGAGRRAQGRA